MDLSLRCEVLLLFYWGDLNLLDLFFCVVCSLSLLGNNLIKLKVFWLHLFIKMGLPDMVTLVILCLLFLFVFILNLFVHYI
jgi:hypothetical protein